jgi:hypothetical protein
MEEPPTNAPPHALGCGHIAVPAAEVDSRRYGTILLLDEDGAPVVLNPVLHGMWAALTLTPPDVRAIAEPDVSRWHLLAAGNLFTQKSVWEGLPGVAVGVEPGDQRFTGWLDVPARSDLAEEPVWLEAHPTWPCPCITGKRRARGNRGGGRP